jgi:DtxR family transcriptional regulator, Mn-dependent transcriptional regulator
MAHSQTVENYLKTIFQAQMALESASALVPMGQLATALGVVPGTATTMVKALADSGLAHYEPYAGVRLSPAGEKLAALVLRRHRLIELFLVNVMGMSWTEVHDEAENLEHAVSDRLIDRIDEMLGRPAVDPHGDPIPDPEGTVPMPEYDSLLTCPLGAPVTISRVSDQDRAFLQFAERHDLRPGDVVRVEERSAAGDSVQLRGRNERRITIGARAASKVLVQAVRMIVIFLLASRAVLAQTPAKEPEAGTVPFKITDNSFLVEEAFNQEAGVFQNIFGAIRINGTWASAFTQEWPLASQTHQFSYTLAFLDDGSQRGAGDVLLNYRYQAMTEAPGRPAFSPRLSLILPAGDTGKGLGDGSLGLQVNLPFSKQRGDWYWHWNAGMTWLPRAEATFQRHDLAVIRHDNVTSPFVAGSGIYRLRPMFHLMMESVISFDQSLAEVGTRRDTTFTLSPGFRGGWNIGDKQVVVGFALPTTWSDTTNTGAFLYFSYELPFKKN